MTAARAKGVRTDFSSDPGERGAGKRQSARQRGRQGCRQVSQRRRLVRQRGKKGKRGRGSSESGAAGWRSPVGVVATQQRVPQWAGRPWQCGTEAASRKRLDESGGFSFGHCPPAEGGQQRGREREGRERILKREREREKRQVRTGTAAIFGGVFYGGQSNCSVVGSEG